MLSSHIPFCFALPRVHTCTFHTSHHLDSMVAFLMVHIWFWHYHQHFQCNYILHNQRDTMTPQSKFDWFKHHLYLIKTSVQNQLPLTRSFWFTPFLVCTSPPVELLLFCKLDSCHVKLEKLVQIYLSMIPGDLGFCFVRIWLDLYGCPFDCLLVTNMPFVRLRREFYTLPVYF